MNYPAADSSLEASRLAFMAMIAESQSGDTTRLVFADWWEEHGYWQRAEMIRDEIEHNTTRWCSCHSTIDRTPCRTCLLMGREAYEFRSVGMMYQTQRGLIEGACVQMDHWDAVSGELASMDHSLPFLRRVTFTDRKPFERYGWFGWTHSGIVRPDGLCDSTSSAGPLFVFLKSPNSSRVDPDPNHVHYPHEDRSVRSVLYRSSEEAVADLSQAAISHIQIIESDRLIDSIYRNA